MVLESTRQKNVYRGAGSSKEVNQRNTALIKDINTLFTRLNENEEAIEANMDIVLRENFFLQNHIALLKQEVAKLQSLVEENQEYEDAEGIASNIFVQNFYQTEAFRNGGGAQTSYVDRTHGTISPLATDTSSKFSYITDTGEIFLPSGLEIFVKEAKNNNLDAEGRPVYYDLVDTNTKSMVDKDKNTFWIRNVSFDQKESVTEVFGEVHIKLPTKGLNNLYANALTVHPYPEGSMRIRDIQYKGYGDQWSRLENYPVTQTVDGEKPVSFETARKLFFQFGRTEMTEIRISYSQPYWFENGNQSIFSYGFQDINLEYRIYTEKACDFISTIDLTSKNALFNSIDYPQAIAAPGTENDLKDLVEHHLYYDETLETEFDFNETVLSSLSKVYVKTVLKKEGDSLPVLKEIRFPYTFRKAEGVI